MERQYQRLTLACYTESLSMAVVCNLPPVLFLTFRTLFGMSYTQLGLLIFINYTTQLLVDLLFSFFPYKFNIAKTVKFTPILTVVGMLVYSLWHLISPGSVYLGFVIGTVIFSAAAGCGCRTGDRHVRLCRLARGCETGGFPQGGTEREVQSGFP